jgi:hypothetical protein
VMPDAWRLPSMMPCDLYRIGNGFLNCPDVAADDERPAEPALPHLYM